MNAVSTTFLVGPVRVTLDPMLPAFERRIDEQLQIFKTSWDASPYEVRLRVQAVPAPAVAARGTYLTCSRMDIDTTPRGLYATTLCGASAQFETAWDGGESWTIDFPADQIDTPAIDQLEDLVGLALVSGWRAAGWTPVHGAAVTRDGKCLLLCAMSGGGKSTLTAALVRDGWQTLGDDKLLLRMGPGGIPEVAALLHSFNLHPKTREWFPEVGDLELQPRYSAWTPKRKVFADDVWPGRTAQRAHPTHIIRVRRDAQPVPIRIAPLSAEEMFRTLIGQIAIPKDSKIAAAAMRTASLTVRSGLRGLDVVIGEDAYQDPATLAALTAAL
ncbi:MAG: hypothetical protein ABSH03_04115 [Candidatus Lustribacter sp.]|jgi:hypothetical protein